MRALSKSPRRRNGVPEVGRPQLRRSNRRGGSGASGGLSFQDPINLTVSTIAALAAGLYGHKVSGQIRVATVLVFQRFDSIANGTHDEIVPLLFVVIAYCAKSQTSGSVRLNGRYGRRDRRSSADLTDFWYASALHVLQCFRFEIRPGAVADTG